MCYNVKKMCRKSSPEGKGSDYRDTPMGGCFYFYVIVASHLYNISLTFLTSLFMVDFIVCIRVIRVIRSSDHPLSSFVIMSFCLAENHLSPSVIMSFCLKSFLCLRPSLCYSVSKTSPVFICPYVTLSLIYSVCIVLKSLDKDAH